MASAKEVVEIASAEVGTLESPPNSNIVKYSRWYPMPGQPWCAMFVSWVFDKAGIDIPRFAYTPAGAEWFKGRKIGTTDDSSIRPGDVLFFDFPDSLARIQHVGFAVSKFEGGRVNTVEGNTSAGSSGSQDNGGGVFRRVRGPSEIVYIGRPAYDDATDLPRFDVPKSKTWFGKGDEGADIRTWQIDLNRWMEALRDKNKKLTFDFGTLDIDGEFGKDTHKATLTFQNWVNERADRAILDVDGRVGLATIAVMEKTRNRLQATFEDVAGLDPDMLRSAVGMYAAPEEIRSRG